MQRMRETNRGLQFTQDMDVVTFAPELNGDIRVYLQESLLESRAGSRLFTVEGRDNVRCLGEWLTHLSAEDTGEPPVPSSFDSYTVDQYKWVAAVAAAPKERGVGLGEFLTGTVKDVGTDTIEDITALIDSVGELLGMPDRNLRRVENEAFAYPFGIPEGLTPILLATQTYNDLQLQFDELFIHNSLPLESAQQLGAWSLQGLGEIQKKSVWG